MLLLPRYNFMVLTSKEGKGSGTYREGERKWGAEGSTECYRELVAKPGRPGREQR
jgi:hypothetical protein